ncbi:MAG: helix-turn-helix transcriptional regulator [Pseudomonadota bacterium]
MTDKNSESPAQAVSPRSPGDVDRLIGERVRIARKMRDVSQERLGKALGVTFQQVQKYEKGRNRVAASRLIEIAAFLELPVTYFFEAAAKAQSGEAGDAEALQSLDPITAKTALRNLDRCQPDVRERLIELIGVSAGPDKR